MIKMSLVLVLLEKLYIVAIILGFIKITNSTIQSHISRSYFEIFVIKINGNH